MMQVKKTMVEGKMSPLESDGAELQSSKKIKLALYLSILQNGYSYIPLMEV